MSAGSGAAVSSGKNAHLVADHPRQHSAMQQAGQQTGQLAGAGPQAGPVTQQQVREQHLVPRPHYAEASANPGMQQLVQRTEQAPVHGQQTELGQRQARGRQQQASEGDAAGTHGQPQKAEQGYQGAQQHAREGRAVGKEQQAVGQEQQAVGREQQAEGKEQQAVGSEQQAVGKEQQPEGEQSGAASQAEVRGRAVAARHDTGAQAAGVESGLHDPGTSIGTSGSSTRVTHEVSMQSQCMLCDPHIRLQCTSSADLCKTC